MEQFQMDLAGRTLTIETGELAKQAGGAVMVGYGDTRVLVTATGSKEAKDIDFFPLTVLTVLFVHYLIKVYVMKYT